MPGARRRAEQRKFLWSTLLKMSARVERQSRATQFYVCDGFSHCSLRKTTRNYFSKCARTVSHSVSCAASPCPAHALRCVRQRLNVRPALTSHPIFEERCTITMRMTFVASPMLLVFWTAMAFAIRLFNWHSVQVFMELPYLVSMCWVLNVQLSIHSEMLIHWIVTPYSTYRALLNRDCLRSRS
jgi:hypothetical protein